jgi:hypothetical protein
MYFEGIGGRPDALYSFWNAGLNESSTAFVIFRIARNG